jgi:hypothetical protein
VHAAEAAPEDESDTEASILAAMHKADLPPEFSCAYRKTDLLDPAEDKSLWPPGEHQGMEHADHRVADLTVYPARGERAYRR